MPAFRLLTVVVIVIAAHCLASPTLAADYAREARWAAEIRPAILVGEPIELALPSGRRFLAIHAAVSTPRAGVVVIHGSGVHPDWGLIHPLRSDLPEHGYATLSVQMPVLAADAKPDQYPPTFPEAAERIAAAVDYLKQRGHRRIALVAHSLGARMAEHYLAGKHDPAVGAWASIGINSGEFGAAHPPRLPVLDLYGESDFPAVIAGAPKRAAAIQGLRGSAQVMVTGADHFFAGREAELVRWVKGFLDRTVGR